MNDEISVPKSWKELNDENAQLLFDKGELTQSILALRGELIAVKKMWRETIDQNAQLRAELDEAIDLVEEGWSYADKYFQDKWEYKERLAKLKTEAHPERKGNDMSDTKALERALNLVLGNAGLCASYGGVFREAAAELAQLKAENVQLKTYLKVTCHVKPLDKVGFDFEILGKINDLQEQLDEARKVIDAAAHELGIPIPGYIQPVANAAYMLWAWLKAHPERK